MIIEIKQTKEIKNAIKVLVCVMLSRMVSYKTVREHMSGGLIKCSLKENACLYNHKYEFKAMCGQKQCFVLMEINKNMAKILVGNDWVYVQLEDIVSVEV